MLSFRSPSPACTRAPPERRGTIPRRPYLGAETVVQDAHLLKLLITVLKGDFAIVTAGELAKRFPDKNYVRDGLCAIANPSCKKLSSAEPLSADTELLQVGSRSA